MAGAVEFADIAGVEPAIPKRTARLFRRIEVAARHVLAPDEDLAVVGNPDFDAGNRFSDGTFGGVKWMIQRDDRRRFGQPVALDNDESKTSPEGFELGIERRRADNDCPELETEHPVHGAVLPPPLRPVHLLGWFDGRFRGDADDVIPQHFEHLRYADKHRDASIVNLPDDVVR